jgi:choline-glycine betaine transporter
MLEQLTRRLNTLPMAALIAILVLAVVQLVLQAWAIVDLIRRDSVLFGRKWVWLLIIVGASFLGPIIYFALGRHGDVTFDDAGSEDKAAARERWESGLSKLYRDRDQR